MATASLYAEQLIPLGRGFPLWEPEPTGLGEVLIGDVGYVDEGAFFRLFNAMLDADDPMNAGGVPEDFEVLDIDFTTIHGRTKEEPAPLATTSVKLTDVSVDGEVKLPGTGVGGGVKYSFTCEKTRGAAAVFGGPAKQVKLHGKEPIYEYMVKHLGSWCEFSRKKASWLIPANIILVVGFVKTSEWALTAFDNGKKGHSISIQATVGDFGSAKVSGTSRKQVSWEPFKNAGPSKLRAQATMAPPADPEAFANKRAAADAFIAPKPADATDNGAGIADPAGSADDISAGDATDASDAADSVNADAGFLDVGASGTPDTADEIRAQASNPPDTMKPRDMAASVLGTGAGTGSTYIPPAKEMAVTTYPNAPDAFAPAGNISQDLPLNQCLFLSYCVVAYNRGLPSVVKELPIVRHDETQPADYAHEMCCFPCTCIPIPDICKWRVPPRQKPSAKPVETPDRTETKGKKRLQANDGLVLAGPPNPPTMGVPASYAATRLRGGGPRIAPITGLRSPLSGIALKRRDGAQEEEEVTAAVGARSQATDAQVEEIPNNDNCFIDPVHLLAEYIVQIAGAHSAIASHDDLYALVPTGEQWPEDIGKYIKENVTCEHVRTVGGIAYLSPDVQIFADPAASASVDGGIPGYSVDNFPLRTQREESSSAPSDAANVLPAEKANILAHKNRSPPASLQDVEVVEQQQPVEDSTEDPEHIMTDESEHEVDVENQPAARSLVEDPGRVSSDHLEGVERVQEPALDTGDEVNPSSDDSESQIVGSVHESGGSISPAHSSLHHADSEEGAPSKSPTSIRTFKSLPPAQGYGAPPSSTPGVPDLIQSLQQIFKLYTDRSRKFDVTQLQTALFNGDWPRLDIDTVKMLMNLFDSDGSGTIGFDEFQGLWKYIVDWQKAFKYFDRDMSDSIEGHALADSLEQFGYSLSPTVQSLVEKKYASTPHSGYAHQYDVSFNNSVRACVGVKALTEAFQQKDTDRDGWIRINYEDFMQMALLWV